MVYIGFTLFEFLKYKYLTIKYLIKYHGLHNFKKVKQLNHYWGVTAESGQSAFQRILRLQALSANQRTVSAATLNAFV